MFRVIIIFVVISIFIILYWEIITKAIEKKLNYLKSLTSNINEEEHPFGLPFPYTLLKSLIFLSGMIGMIIIFSLYIFIFSPYIMSILPNKPEFGIAYIISSFVCLMGYADWCIRKLENEGKREKGVKELTALNLISPSPSYA